MIDAIIRWSIANRILVLILALALTVVGLQLLRHTPVDAIPDLTDTQVIVRTMYPGQAPDIVEQQVTYPLTRALMAVPGAHQVRGFSMFGDSFVYVLFTEDTDPYWARSRVQEYLGQVQLPADASTRLGPDASGVGWVYKYALVDRSGTHDLAQLRALQDWYLQYELQGLPGVAEVATMGGMVRQYQVALDPLRMRAYGLQLPDIQRAIAAGNAETGGGILELAEAEYMVRASGYVQSLDDLRQIPVGRNADGVPILLQDVADIRRGPAPRRGIADLDGEGEAVGGIIVMRQGANARATINGVKARLQQLQQGLPDGVEIIEAYDRSALISRAINTLWQKLALEFVVVIFICALFLWHLRSSLVILLSLPLGVLTAYIIMYLQGINANIMSLAGIAISIGVMVDAAIVMIENAHSKLEQVSGTAPLSSAAHWQQIEAATLEVGRPVFLSLLIVALSFLPVFALQAQEGRLFSPLAFTKTYSMAAGAGLAITLVPVLMGYFVRGRIRPQQHNPMSRGLQRLYLPLLRLALHYPWWVLATALLLGASLWVPLRHSGTEFMPPLDEGDLMYMPTTLPGLAPDKARELLQQTHSLIRQTPEVAHVFGKAGRADTATDPAPLTMLESFIRLKPKSQWRPGLSTADLIAELDARVQLPGVTNAWVFPIQTRIDMLQTGIRTHVGIGITGPDLTELQNLAQSAADLVAALPGTRSAFADRPAAGRYLHIEVDRLAAARHGMNIDDVHAWVRAGIGGLDVTETVEGLERYPINLRYLPAWRDTPGAIAELPLVTPAGAHISLGELAQIQIVDGPAMIRSENSRPASYVYVDLATADLSGWVQSARALLAQELTLPSGYALQFAGQYEYLERAMARLQLLIPLVAVIVLVLLLLTFSRFSDALWVLLAVPLSLAGGLWLMYLLGHQLSIAVAVGLIALGGLAAETGVIMVLYLNQALAQWQQQNDGSRQSLVKALGEGALRRVRPITMTETTVFIGLLPVMLGTGTGAEVMQRIAAPMVGGVFTVWLVALVVLPAFYLLWHGRQLPTTPVQAPGR